MKREKIYEKKRRTEHLISFMLGFSVARTTCASVAPFFSLPSLFL
jgi:hypothetical protein